MTSSRTSFVPEGRVWIVAEIGNNHEGKFEVAKELLRRAAECGVDAVKFQTYQTERFVRPSDEARFRRLKGFELTQLQFRELAGLARQAGIMFMSTPLDLESADFLGGIVDAMKVASGDNNFYPLLDRVAKTGKPVIVSTGASDMDQVRRTVAYVKERWAAQGTAGQLAILHCVSSYPVPPEQVNLRSIPYLAEAFPGIPVGYSDHTIGLEAACWAVALGARIIEKHFTLDKQYSDFRDHQLSADPVDMKELVRRIREGVLMLGIEGKGIQPCEKDMTKAIRRSIAAASDLPKGHRIAASDLAWFRPGDGLPPGEESGVVGKTIKRTVTAGDFFRIEDFV